MMKTALFLAATFGWSLSAHAALADEPSSEPSVVTRYDAPPECPSAEAFAASVRGELAARPPSHARPLQVSVVIVRGAGGYSADATAVDDEGHALERTVQAPTCDELAEIAAALVGLAQTGSHPADRADVAQASLSATPRSTTPGAEADAHLAAAGNDHYLTFDFSVGYSAFAVGPANAVVQSASQKTTFNPAQGARIGFGVSHAFGWWKPSLEVSAAYYRQSTTTTATTLLASNELGLMSGVDIGDRDVLQATFDACPIRLEYSFLSLLPCATFSMTQTRGNSGNDPELETGLGGSLRLRGSFAHAFFAEAMGSAVGVTSSYEPPSSGARVLYALSLGASIR
jgi:hypothetical protein